MTFVKETSNSDRNNLLLDGFVNALESSLEQKFNNFKACVVESITADSITKTQHQLIKKPDQKLSKLTRFNNQLECLI
jgi:hypothetical protein